MNSSFLFLLFIITSNSIATIKVLGYKTAKKPTRIAMKLIHRDTLTRPRVRTTPEDHINHLTDVASSRFIYLQNIIDKELRNSDFQIDTQLATDASMFFVNFSVGHPPVHQITLMDTGSSLMWIQCLPCKHCSDLKTPIFNPTFSSTFLKCSCNDPSCKNAPNPQCSSSNECLYSQVYINGAGSKGDLVKDRLTFTTPGKTKVVTEPVVFGCGYQNGEEVGTDFTGILGLGTKPTSLAVQLGSKFSYCIGDLTNKDYGYNQLVLGEDADILGDPTPIKTDSGIYHMNLEGISIGETELDIKPEVFTRKGSKSGVILDTGTLFTWLADKAYRELYNKVKSILDTELERYWYRDFLCYHGRVSVELEGFPIVTFRFAGGAELALEATSMFYPMPESDFEKNVFCMAVRPTTEHGRQYKDFTVFGLMAQQYYNIGYDLKEENVYLQRIDCVLLDDYSPP